MGDARLIKLQTASHSPALSTLKFWLLLFVFALGCIAVANPRIPDESSAEQRKGIDLVLALDVSNSMLATDLEPNRLTRAKLFITKLIDKLKDDRIGLVLFAGKSYVQMPLTFDQSAARMYVSTASPNTITAQGTSVADALKKSDVAFGETNERFKSIVVITDGESHDDDAVTAAKELAAKGIMINTVGVGSPGGATILDTATRAPKKDASGQVVISKINEQLLREIAAATNGVYIPLQNSDDAVAQILGQYTQIEKKALADISALTYKSFYAWLVLPMLLLALLEIFISDRRKKQKA